MRKPLALIVGLTLFGCKPQPLPGEPNAPQIGATVVGGEEAVDLPLLTIGDRTITLSEFDRRAELLSRTARHRLNSPAQRRRLLEMVVWGELLALDALRLGLVNGLDEELLVADARARSILDDGARRSVNRADITDDEVRAIFDAEADQIQRPEIRRLYTIVRPDLESAQALHSEITALLEFDIGRRIFRALAPLHSVHDETKSDGFVGEVVADSDGDPDFLAAAFSTETEGLVDAVARTSRGYEVILVDLVIEGQEVPYEEFQGRIRNRIHRDRIAARQRAILDEARRSAGVNIDASAVATLAAARSDDPADNLRGRRYSTEWLAEDPRAVLASGTATRVLGEFEALWENPLAASGSVPLDEPAETTDGSGEPDATSDGPR